MASGAIPRPGTKYGPCRQECKHLDCATSRTVAEAVCGYCNKPVGYDTPFYADPDHGTGYCHAICIESAYQENQ